MAQLEWVQVAPMLVVVANQERAWLHQPHPATDDPFAQPMQHAGSLPTTRKLLEGVIGAAQQAVSPTTPPPLSLPRWVWRLVGYYHTTHSTPRLMAEAAERFAATDRQALRAYAQLKVADEAGHDELALRDLRALGYDAEAMVSALHPPTAAALVAYFTETVRNADPVRCVGYAYALERMAISVSRAYIQQIEAMLPPGVHATRCLRVHSSIGADVSHGEDSLTVTAGLSAAERIQVAQACYQTVLLRYTTPPAEQITEAVLVDQLSRFRSRSSV